jgi:hypothetical protein
LTMTKDTSEVVARLLDKHLHSAEAFGCEEYLPMKEFWASYAELSAEAAALISSLVERDEGRLAHIKKLERRIRNQRQNSRDTWEIVEARNKWLGSKASRDGYIRMFHKAKKADEARLTAERLLAEAREALTQIAADLQSSIDTHEFNSRHMIAEDSLRDAWKMLDMAREQFQVDANSLRIPLAKARASIGGVNG